MKNSLLSKVNLPVTHSSRNVGMLGYFFVWVGSAVIIATFALGGDGVQLMTLGWVVLACLIANVILGFFITVNGDIGIEHGLSMPVYLRAPFGIIGMNVPNLIRAVIGSFWFGIQTYFGALAINYIILHFTGFDNWLLWYVVFVAVQVLNTAFGFKAIEKFASIAAPSIIIISIYLYIKLEGVASAKGTDVWNTVLSTEKTGFVFNTFMLLLFLNMAFWSTAASDSQNLTRHVKAPQHERNWWKRNKNPLIGHMIALPLVQTGMIVIGGVSMLALNNWNPVEAIQSTSTGFVLIILLFMVIFAQWSTNAPANLMIPAIAFSSTFTKVSYAGGVVITGILGSIIQPWELMETLASFLNVMSAVYSTIVGVGIADYYFLRKRRINVPDLYKKEGQFFYAKGWNLAGIFAMVLGVISATILSTYAFLAGLVVSCAVYFVLAKFWWFKKYKQVEIEENHPDKYLGITAGRDWVLDVGSNEIVSYTADIKMKTS